MMNKKLLLALAILMKPFVANAQTYTLTNLGTLFAGTGSYGAAINSAGQVTGSSGSGDTAHAFIYSEGTMSDLGVLGKSFSGGQAINRYAQVTGQFGTVATEEYTAFLYRKGTLSSLGGDFEGAYSLGNGINDIGQIVGQTCAVKLNQCVPFLLSVGESKSLGSLGGVDGAAQAINNHGDVTGWSYLTAVAGSQHAFMYSAGKMTDLGTLGGQTSYGYAINSIGQITGVAYTTNDAAGHAFIYEDGKMNDIGTLGGSFVNSVGKGINDVGQIVGSSTTTNNQLSRAFFYADGKMTDLNKLIDSNDALAQYVVLTDAEAINDNGIIVANGFDALDGQNYAFLLTPSKEKARP